MVLTKTKPVIDSKTFVNRLVDNDYRLKDDDFSNSKLIFNSEWNNPTLYRVDNYHFKINYLVNQLEIEMKKFNLNVPASKIRQDVLKKDVVVYQIMRLDNETGRLVDYFFILDSKQFKVMVFKRFTNFAYEQQRAYRAIKYLHDELFMDFEEIYYMLARNGFDITEEMAEHIVRELRD